VKCQLNYVRNALNKNSTLRIRLLEGSGSDYVVCPLIAFERTKILWSTSMSQLNYNSKGCLPQTEGRVRSLSLKIVNVNCPPLPPPTIMRVICATRSLLCLREFCANRQWHSFWSADWNIYLSNTLYLLQYR